jgi:hypothetical protein
MQRLLQMNGFKRELGKCEEDSSSHEERSHLIDCLVKNSQYELTDTAKTALYF